MRGFMSALSAALTPYARAVALTYAGAAAIGMFALVLGLAASTHLQVVPPEAPGPSAIRQVEPPVTVPPPQVPPLQAPPIQALPVPAPPPPAPPLQAPLLQPAPAEGRVAAEVGAIPDGLSPSIHVWPQGIGESVATTTVAEDEDGSQIAAGDAITDVPSSAQAPDGTATEGQLPEEDIPPAEDDAQTVATIEQPAAPVADVPAPTSRVMSTPEQTAAARPGSAQTASQAPAAPPTPAPAGPPPAESHVAPVAAPSAAVVASPPTGGGAAEDKTSTRPSGQQPSPDHGAPSRLSSGDGQKPTDQQKGSTAEPPTSGGASAATKPATSAGTTRANSPDRGPERQNGASAQPGDGSAKSRSR